MAEAWLKAAQQLREGSKGRASHGCGEGRTLLVAHERDKWTAWCFRCQESLVEFKPQLSFSERMKRDRERAAEDETIARYTVLPTPVVDDLALWPIEARLWLLKASIGAPETRQLGAYYHPPTNRVVLPVFDSGRLAYWQARSIDGRQPKYLGAAIDKRSIVAQFGKPDSPVTVLTEDVLSAFRCGDHVAAWALLGTALTDKVLARLIAAQKPVITWLDPDAAGRKAVRRITTRLALVGVPHRNIVSPFDPKLLPRGEIKSLLTKACSDF